MTDSFYMQEEMYPNLVNQDSPEVRRSFISKHQITGWRFMLQRAASSITESIVTPYVEPLLSYHRTFTLGLVSICLGVIVCFVYSLINPASLAKNNSIAEDRIGHNFYVITDNVVHPVMNMTSARLIIGQPVEPILVKPEELRKFPLGDRVGIPGAPDAIAIDPDDKSQWEICDHQAQVWVFHPHESIKTDNNLRSNGVIVSHRGVFWLLWDHYRSKLPSLNWELLYSLGFTGRLSDAPVISDALFNSIPQHENYFAPHINHYGSAVAFSVDHYPELNNGKLHIGSLLQTTKDIHFARYFLVEQNGIQEIPSTIDALFRTRHPYSTIILQNSDLLYSLPAAHEIDIAQYPNHAFSGINAVHAPFICMLWQRKNELTSPVQTLFFAEELPELNTLHQALPNTNTGFESRDSSLVKLSDDMFKGSTFWLSPLGISYGLPAESMHALGVTQKPVLIPWCVFTLYSRGSALTRENALTSHTL